MRARKDTLSKIMEFLGITPKTNIYNINSEEPTYVDSESSSESTSENEKRRRERSSFEEGSKTTDISDFEESSKTEDISDEEEREQLRQAKIYSPITKHR